jgi:aspartate aminotransferase
MGRRGLSGSDGRRERIPAKRDVLCDALTPAGYDAPRPQGSYYVFAKTPIPDDIEFIGMLQKKGILAVPGTGFGRPG